jgi:hypothetical protein
MVNILSIIVFIVLLIISYFKDWAGKCFTRWMVIKWGVGVQKIITSRPTGAAGFCEVLGPIPPFRSLHGP